MSRNLLGLFALALIGGFVVAIVQAQDSSRRPASSGVPTPAQSPPREAPYRFGDDGAAPVADAQSDRGSVLTATSTRRTSGGGLADRLQAIRQSVTSEYGGDDAGASVLPESPTATNLQSAPPGVAFGEQSGAGSAVPSVLKRGQAAASEPAAGTPLVASRDGEDASSSRRTARLQKYPAATSNSTGTDIQLSSKNPELRVDTNGPRAITIGKQATYTVTVTSLNDTEAHELVISIELPEWIQLVNSDATIGAARQESDAERRTRITWTVDRLPGRAQEQLVLNVIPQQSRAFDLLVEWAILPTQSLASVEVLEPRLTMALTGPKDVLYGATNVYTITLGNPGTGDAENVVVSLAPLAGSGEPVKSAPIGTIEAGGQKTFEVQLTARQTGQIEIHADAIADGGLRAEAAEAVLVRRANVQVSVTGPNLVYAGSVASYQVRVANIGNATANEVLAAVILPAGSNYLGKADGGKPTAGGVTWSLGELAAGAERILEINAELNTDGENRLEIGVRTSGGLSASAVSVTQVEALADLKLEVEDPKGPQSVGEPVTYQVRIRNRGTKAARQVNVVAQFSPGIEPVAAEGGRAEILSGQVVFLPIARIDEGQAIVLKVTARAETSGNHVFRTEVKCSDPETRLVFEGTTKFFGDAAQRPATRSAVPEIGRRPVPAQPMEIRR